MKQTFKWNPLESTEGLYDNLELALWDELYGSKKHKAYYLFSVLYSEGWWAENNVEMIREAILNHSLHLIWERRHPDNHDDDNIDIYFLEDAQGKSSIVLLHSSLTLVGEETVLDIIPVNRRDYEMTQIYPAPLKPPKSDTNKKPVLNKVFR
jgi:hypothetical protein